MKIGVMGAGAVGCYYGALLARAGHEVTLVGRAPFVEHVLAAGLLLTTGGFTAAIPVQATTDTAALSGSDFVLFCVKSADTQTAGRLLSPVLDPACPVLSFQNGVDNPERLALVLGRPVVPVAVYVAVEMTGPGHVKHLGRGDVILGRFAGEDAIAGAFRAAGIPATVSDTVVVAQWSKFITNCAYNALSAITRMPYGALLQVPGVAQVMTDVATECMVVGRALGVPVASLDMAPILGLAATMPGQLSSTAQDLLRGKPTEIDYLNGYIVRKGAECGIPTPANHVLWTLVKALESKLKD